MVFQPTIFAQVMSLVDYRELRRCIDRYRGDYRVRRFSSLNQFLCMAFAQLAQKKSLRAAVFSLERMQRKLYHMGMKAGVTRSTLCDANNRRDWRIWRDYAQSLISCARKLYQTEDIHIDETLQMAVYAFDASTIDLCLSVFSWADFRKTKAGIKLHTQLDLRGLIPVYVDIDTARGSDVKALDKLQIEPNSLYLLDRGYLDWSRLHKLHLNDAFFITRTKKNTRFRRVYSNNINEQQGVICDQTGVPELKKVANATLKRFAA